jgi:CxxC motif-containing protein (DUF1111 family)
MSSQLTAVAISVVGVAVACGMGCGGEGLPEDVGSSSEALNVGSAIPGLTSAQLAAFNAGAAHFSEVETVANGLGPVFNEKECGTCHDEGALGGAGVQVETRAGRLTGTSFNPLASEGGSLFQHFGIGGQVQNKACTTQGETVPQDANVTAGRRTIPLFGDGLVDATPDSTFQAIASSQPSAIRGTAPLVPNISAGRNTVGKFGWKDQNPTLFQFSGDAYVNEMGITNPQFPTENLPQGSQSMLTACDTVADPEDDGTDVKGFTTFMQFLAPPPRGSITSQVTAGDAIFTKLGCDGCHVRNITSGTAHDVNGNTVAALSGVTYHPFGDFLMHDMGSLGDDIDQGTGLTAMRTQPLWGLRFENPSQLLHDGRATSIQQAIQLHAGQGAAAAAAFGKLSPGDQNNLLSFLRSL